MQPQTCEKRRPPGLEEEVVEVPLLLPARQLAALERLASARGLTVGQLCRWLVRDYLGAPRGVVTEVATFSTGGRPIDTR
jgi:hypothetical protein